MYFSFENLGLAVYQSLVPLILIWLAIWFLFKHSSGSASLDKIVRTCTVPMGIFCTVVVIYSNTIVSTPKVSLRTPVQESTYEKSSDYQVKDYTKPKMTPEARANRLIETRDKALEVH